MSTKNFFNNEKEVLRLLNKLKDLKKKFEVYIGNEEREIRLKTEYEIY